MSSNNDSSTTSGSLCLAGGSEAISALVHSNRKVRGYHSFTRALHPHEAHRTQIYLYPSFSKRGAIWAVQSWLEKTLESVGYLYL